jgi:hypothetical protein
MRLVRFCIGVFIYALAGGGRADAEVYAESGIDRMTDITNLYGYTKRLLGAHHCNLCLWPELGAGSEALK